MDKHPRRTALRLRVNAPRRQHRIAGKYLDISSVDDLQKRVLVDAKRMDACRIIRAVRRLNCNLGAIDRDVAPVHGDIIRFFLTAFPSNATAWLPIGKDAIGALRRPV